MPLGAHRVEHLAPAAARGPAAGRGARPGRRARAARAAGCRRRRRGPRRSARRSRPRRSLNAAEPAQLAQAQRREHVGQPVVEAELVHLLVPGALVGVAHLVAVTDQPDEVEPVRPLAELGVERRDRAALGGRHVLRREERERREVGERADGSAPVRRADRVGGVLERASAPTRAAVAEIASDSTGWPA